MKMNINPAMMKIWSPLGSRNIATMPASMLMPRATVDLDVIFNVSESITYIFMYKKN